MDYSLLKVGNSIVYNGSLNDYRNQIGTITSISQDETFSLSIKKKWPPNSQASNIVAYTKDVMPVIMNIGKLNDLGFALNEKTNVISRQDVNIINVAYVKPYKDDFGHDRLSLDVKGFRLVVNGFPLGADEDVVLKNTIDVNSLHSLQNYYFENLKEELYLPD